MEESLSLLHSEWKKTYRGFPRDVQPVCKYELNALVGGAQIDAVYKRN